MKVGSSFTRIVFLFSLLFFFSGSRCDQTREQEQTSRFLLSSFLFSSLEWGHCLHSVKVSDHLAYAHCYSAPRILCEDGKLYDPGGLQFVSRDTYSRYLAEWEQIKEDFPQCEDASVYALVDPGIQPSPDADSDSIKEKNEYRSVQSCGDLENPDRESLIQKEEYRFLTSAKGLLAWKAKAYNQNECLDSLMLSAGQISLIESIQDGSKILRTTCMYGDTPLEDCSASEKNLAHPFFD